MSAATWGVYHATSGSESPPRVPPPFLPSVLRAVGQDPDPFPLVERPYVFVLQCNDAVVAVFESEQAAERVARKLNFGVAMVHHPFHNSSNDLTFLSLASPSSSS